MAAPAPLAEDFIACTAAVFTVTDDATPTPGTWTGTVTDGGLTHTYDVDEMTNNEGEGFYEDVKTTQKWEGDVTIAWRVISPPPMKSGDLFNVAITLPDGPSITGKFRFNGFNFPMMSPKLGLKLKGKITSQGTIVYDPSGA